MAETYFMFKTLRVNTIGGMMPPNVTIQGSLGEWYYGKVTDKDILWNIREYYPMVIDKDCFDGLAFHGITQVPVDPFDPESDMRDLTTEELALQIEADLMLKKFSIRASVESEVGDVYDLISDMSKQISLLEKVVYETVNDLYTSDAVSQTVKDKYSAMVTSNVTNINDDTKNDTTDLEDTSDIIDKTAIRKNQVYNIKKTEYDL